jgi:hypothetical protein
MTITEIAPRLTEGLWRHQERHVAEHGMDPEYVLLWQPRVGKSLAAARDVLRWRLEAGVRRVVLAAPKTVCATVWAPLIAAEAARIAKMQPSGALEPPQVLDLYSGTIEHRRTRLRTQKGMTTPWVIAIVNRDALTALVDDLVAWVSPLPSGLVLDELHDYKTASSARGRAAFRIARMTQFRRGLTGTPASEGYEDLYGQWKIVAPEIFGTRKVEFLERYVVFDPHARYPKITGYQNVDELKTKAFSIASVVKRSDCFEIPPEQDVERIFALPPAAQKVYDGIIDDHILELQNGGVEIPVRHTFSRLIQLRQICVGFARYWDPNRSSDDASDDDRKTVEWLHDGKMDIVKAEVADLLESKEKVVLFHAFSPERERLMHALRDYKPLALYGGTPADARLRFLDMFRKQADHSVLIAQESVASLGISLAAADYAIFVSFGPSRAVHTQARDRIFKPAGEMVPGKHLTTIYPLAANSVEISMRALHANKQNMEEYLLSGDRSKTFVAMARGAAK